MKDKLKKNINNLNDQQQSRRDAQSETNHQLGVQPKATELGAQLNDKADSENKPRQSAQSGRKSRDNFGSYKGY